ncbi:MAG: C4-dicarboxylate ABC transporter permease [Treponema sp. GWB1_62_6]|nr:MAG: C4-dicarboxylate ABC transporter permease [Treponema sp. GWA1_62_8]OHE62932.1 MAG: C4-dicarboxylate ABC transporter permease [Treponema sp. GWB1_62_6]OHE68245.1 MAG: C4-dicarboxylate ABC transporter permease [Treponema sp. RIFOXYC1_FULL_61_9]OHE69521.1 MAG: C4-dicarboxylate ABC transporter permease [Treponema sp. GWC1_61_84]HCM25875.1 C4-dicarboxylate ABC transporter permease [Treponema sp.]
MGFIFIGIFLLLTLIGVPVAFSLCLSVAWVVVTNLHSPLVMIPQILTTGIDSFSFMAVPFFMLAGSFMSAGGVTKRLVSFAQSMVGSLWGGLAQVVCVAGMFFAAISGSSAATTAAIGSTMIDEMEKKGYKRDFAAATVAAAGTVGIVIPPSITMVVYGVIAGVSIGDLFVGGFAPGILMGLSMMLVAYFISRKNGWKGEGKFTVKSVAVAFKDSFFALLTPVIIIGGIYGGIFTPTEAAAVAAVYGLVVGLFVYKELKVKDLPELIFKAVISTVIIMFIVGASSVFGWMLTNLRIPQQLAQAVMSATMPPALFLLIVNVLFLIAGTMVNASAAIVILGPIVLPIALGLGINPVFFGVLMVVNLAIGCITPPVGLDLFVASAITKIPIEQLIRRVMPYLLVLLVDLMILTYIPQIIMFLPNLLH